MQLIIKDSLFWLVRFLHVCLDVWMKAGVCVYAVVELCVRFAA